MNTSTPTRPRRSALYSPGANPRAMQKIPQVDADVFILDLEDSATLDGKTEARDNVRSFLEQWQPDSREMIVRVNGADTIWCREDIASVVGLGIDGILVPKINSADDVQRVEEMLDSAGAPPRLRLWCMIETPLAVLNLQPIAQQAAARASRMSVWVMGTNDLAKELRAAHTPERTPMLYALSAAVMAARAYGIAILDGVHNDIADPDGLARTCEQARALGFDGKTLIHPSQVAICNRVFSPDPQAVLQARKIIEAFQRPENAGKGVLQVDGKMVELLHAEIARATIAIAEAIASREASRG